MATTAPVLETLAPLVGGTPDEVERYRKLAEALLEKAGSGEPVEHWMEGVGRLALALSSRSNERKAAQMEKGGEAEKWANITAGVDAGLFGGGGEYADVPGAEAVSGDDAATMQYAGGAPPADAASVYQGMIKRGLTPAQAAAFAGNVQQESGFRTTAHNVGEGAHGIIQWREDRFRNLQNFAAKQGKPWTDIDTQMDFALWEMQNTEAGAGQQLRSAQTVEDANRALKGYIRYGDESYGTRLNNARRIGQLPVGETADIPGAEPVSTAPSPEVMAHITGRQPTPALMKIGPNIDTMGAPPPAGTGTVPLPPVPAPPPPPGSPPPGGAGTVAMPPVAAPPSTPPLAARVPQPRPALPVAPAAPATTGTVAAPAPARPVYAPPVKNDYNAMPGRPPAAMPMRPGQLMQEPYSGPMSAQEFARQGQAAMRAQRAGQQPTGLAQALQAPTPGGQPVPPRRRLLQALFGRGGPQGAGGAPAAPAAPAAAPMDPKRAALARVLNDPRVPDALKIAALKNMTPAERKLLQVPAGGALIDPVTHEEVYRAPFKPEDAPVTTRPLVTPEERAAAGIPANDPKPYQVDSTGKVSAVGGGGVNVDLSGGGSEKQIYETLGASADSARAAITGLNGIREARTALQGGIITGAGADVRLGLQKLGAFLGVADPGVIQNTETFRAAIAPQVAAMLKATVGTAQISNTDRAFAEKAAGGDINLDQATIERLLGIMEKAGRVVVETHQKKLDAVYPADGDYARERALFGVEVPEVEAEAEPTSAQPARPTSEAEYDALPSGTRYVAPDGSIQEKP